MPEPQALQFWAPQPEALNVEPLIRGAENLAAGIQAGGRALGEAVAQSAAEMKRERAFESVNEAMLEIGKEGNYETVDFDPSLEDPTLRTEGGMPLDRMGRRQAILERMERIYPHEVALQKAIQMTTPVPRRVMKPEAVEKIRGLRVRSITLARAAGMDPAEVQRGIELVQPEAFENLGDAHRWSMQRYTELASPPAAEAAMLQAFLSGREREKDRAFQEQERRSAQTETRQLIRLRAGLDAEAADTAETRARERMALEAEQRTVRDQTTFDQQVRMLNYQHRLDLERLERASQLDTQSRQAIEQTKGELAQELATLKSSGGVTPSDLQTAQEFSLVVDEAAVRGQAFEGVPLRTVAALVGDVGDYVRSVAGGGAAGGGVAVSVGGGQNSDLSTLMARIGPDGNVQLVDTNTRSAFTQSQLDQIARSAFRSSAARDAVVIQQFYGSTFESREKLATLQAIDQQAQRVGGMGVLGRARMLLAQVAGQGGPKAASESAEESPASGNPRNRMRR